MSDSDGCIAGCFNCVGCSGSCDLVGGCSGCSDCCNGHCCCLLLLDCKGHDIWHLNVCGADCRSKKTLHCGYCFDCFGSDFLGGVDSGFWLVAVATCYCPDDGLLDSSLLFAAQVFHSIWRSLMFGEGYILKNKAKNPFPMNYQPKLDVSYELGLELSYQYLQLIGIARWAIELRNIDIHHKVSLLSQYQANLRVGHLEALYHVLHISKVDKSAFNNGTDWKEFYGEVQEEWPPKMPKLRGQRVTISAFVDANHAGWKQSYKMFAHRYYHLCSECSNPLVQ